MHNRQGNLLPALLFTASLFVAACSAQVDKNNVVLQQISPSFTFQADLTPTNTPLPPIPEVIVTLVEKNDGSICTAKNGHITRHSIKSKVLAGDLEFSIYLPPCYDPTEIYPVLYMLHGLTYTDDQWGRLGIASSADSMITDGEIKPLVIVMPYNPSPKLPSTNRFGLALIDELIPHIETNYTVCKEQSCRMIGGLSRGGGWAYDLFVHHPDVFSKVGGHSPAMFKHDPRYLVWWIENAYQGQQLWVDVGDKDAETGYLLDIQKRLAEKGIDMTFHIWPGIHEEAYWQEHVTEYLSWYMQGSLVLACKSIQ